MSRHTHGTTKTRTRKHQPKPQPAHVAHFVALHIGDARTVSTRTSIPAEVILAQSALESNRGRSVKDNAYFGIKGKSESGRSTTFSTHEVTLSGQRIGVTDEFRAYTDYAEAAADYASLIQRKYPTALAYRNDPERFAEAVASHGYATDPLYAQKLKSIIRSHIVPLVSR